MDEVMRSLLAGEAWWHPETGELVFYDEVYDEPPEGPGGTFCSSWIDPERVAEAGGDVWACYNPGADDCVGRLEAVSAIASQPGWEKVGR